MKKLILLLFILPIFCFAQTNVTPQWKKFPVFDSLGYSITGSTGNHWLYDAHFIRVNYLTKSQFTDSLRAHKIYFTNNFQKIGDTIDVADTIRKTNWVFKGGLILDDSLLAQNKLLWLKGSVTSNPYLARSMALETRLHAASNFALLLNMDLNAAFYDHGFTNVYHAQLKSSGDMIPGLDTLYNLGHIDTISGRHYQWKNVYSKRLISDYDLHLQSNTSKIYFDGLPDTTAGYKAVVVDANGKLQRAPYGSGGSDSTIYKTDDSIHNTDRTVDLKLHTLLFKGKSAADSLGVAYNAVDGFTVEHYNHSTNLDAFLQVYGNGISTNVTDSIGNTAVLLATTNSGSSPITNTLIGVQGPGGNATIQAVTGNTSGFKALSINNSVDQKGVQYDSYLDYLNADSLTLMPKQYNDAHYAPITGGGYVPTSRTLTINGTAFDLSANRSWSVGTMTSLTPGYGFTSSTPITGSGTMTIDTAKLQTVLNFFPKADTRYYKLSNPSAYIPLTAISATSPIFYNNTTGVISSQAASASQNGYLTSTDWSTFNGKQAALVSGTNIKTVNGVSILGSGDLVVGSSVTPVSGETPTGTINGTNPTFTIAHTPISGSVSVYINGLMERPTTDWTISGTTLTMIDIPATGDNLMVTYQY